MKRTTYMTGGQLSLALTQIGWDPDTAAHKLGQNRRRLMEWLHDADSIPRWVPLFFTAMTVVDAREKVLMADQHLIDAEKAGGHR